jgi:transposase InsO family protein
MKAVRLEYPVTMLCKALGVSRSGFYDWLHAKPSARAREDASLKVLIIAAHRQSRETYGTRRVKHELAAQGHDVGRDRVGRLRRELALRCKQRRKFVATTNSRHDLPVAENLLEQRFTPTRPGEVWVTDITYIPTAEGWLYLAGLKDVFTCEIVGYAMGERMTQDLTAQALYSPRSLLHHSAATTRNKRHHNHRLTHRRASKAANTEATTGAASARPTTSNRV